VGFPALASLENPFHLSFRLARVFSPPRSLPRLRVPLIGAFPGISGANLFFRFLPFPPFPLMATLYFRNQYFFCPTTLTPSLLCCFFFFPDEARSGPRSLVVPLLVCSPRTIFFLPRDLWCFVSNSPSPSPLALFLTERRLSGFRGPHVPLFFFEFLELLYCL